MKDTIMIRIAKQAMLLVAALLLASLTTRAQEGRIKFDALSHLETKAAQSVEVNVEAPLLQLIPKLAFRDESADERTAKEIIAGIKGVYVRHYEFEKPGEYTESDVEVIRSQLRGWSKVVGVRSKREGQAVEVHTLAGGAKLSGLVILALGSKELTLVNVAGEIDLEKIIEMARRFGLLEIEIDKTKKE